MYFSKVGNAFCSKMTDSSLNNFSINGKSFEKSFLEFCPRGEEPEEGTEFTVAADREYTAISENLKKFASIEKRSMEIEDLILELFSDMSYSIRDIFNNITGSDAVTESMYK